MPVADIVKAENRVVACSAADWAVVLGCDVIVGLEHTVCAPLTEDVMIVLQASVTTQ